MLSASRRIFVLACISTAAAFVYFSYVSTNKFVDEYIGSDWYSNGLASLEDERNEKPLQVLLVSTCRSGSSFIGELLASIPDSMYYFEPLKHLRGYLFRIQGPPMSDEALTLIRNLLNCNNFYFQLEHEFIRRRYEKLSGIVSAVSVPRYETSTTALADYSQLRVLYVVRDPRGSLNSRWKAKVLKRESTVTALLCMDLVSEFYATKRLRERFPDRFNVIRYEELAVNPSGVTKEILRFLGLKMHSRVVKFIAEHTHVQRNGTFNLHRDSPYTATKWTKDLPYDTIAEIQNDDFCQRALRAWGYKTISNVSLQRDVVPY